MNRRSRKPGQPVKTFASVAADPTLIPLLNCCSPLRLLELGVWLDAQAGKTDADAATCGKLGKSDLAQVHRTLASIKRMFAEKLRALAGSKIAVAPVPPSGTALN